MGKLNGVDAKTSADWASDWLDGVVSRGRSMAQRKLSSIEARAGGLAHVRELAKQRGVHLLLIEDDKGNELVAASLKPFTVVC